MSAAARLAATLRARILDGELRAGTPLREQHIADESGASRHTVRAALRELAAEGLAAIEANRGARVRSFTRADVVALGELRIALEVEAARLALARHGRLPGAVHAAAADLRAATGFAAVTIAHERLHTAIVAAAESPRILAAYHPLAGELRLFLAFLAPFWDVADLAAEHDSLLADLESRGPDALRVHITDSTAALTTGLKF